MYWSRLLVIFGTVLAALAALLSLLVWQGDASVETGLILTCGFAGAALIGAGVLTR